MTAGTWDCASHGHGCGAHWWTPLQSGMWPLKENERREFGTAPEEEREREERTNPEGQGHGRGREKRKPQEEAEMTRLPNREE